MANTNKQGDDGQGSQPTPQIEIPPTNTFEHYALKPLPVLPMGILLERLDRYDSDEKKATGDGNCQMRALSKLLHERQQYYAYVRSQIVDELKGNPEKYMRLGSVFYHWMVDRTEYDGYVANMSIDKQWGDFVTLIAAANLYRVRIIVYCSFLGKPVLEFAPEDRRSKADIFLTYMYENDDYAHYNAAYPKTGIPPVDIQSPSPSDSPSLLDQLHGQWNLDDDYLGNYYDLI